jgi:hypothetical protein
MQYNYEEKFDNFEDEVLHRLNNIEKRMNDMAASNTLANELVRAQLSNSSGSSNLALNSSSSMTRKPFFYISTVKNENEENISFRVSGKTFDIKDQLKAMGNCVFDKDSKSWEFAYDEGLYQRVLEFLRSFTDEVNVIV